MATEKVELDFTPDAIDELAKLVETAGGSVVARIFARRNAPDAATFIGSGKAEEVKALAAKHEVTLIESRFDRAEVVESMLPDVTVVHGDACEPEVLEHANVAEADLTIAATGDDEDNLVVSMLAKQHYGTKKVFARINHPKNEWLFDKDFGIDVPVSSTSVMLSLVEKEVGFGDLVTLLRLQADNVSIDEITLPATAMAVGKSLAELSLPENSHIMAIINPESGLTVARGETVLNAGDELLMFSDGKHEADLLDALGIACKVGEPELEPEHPHYE